MQFVFPSFLFALSAVAIPVIIHLFHFRRYKKIVFSDIRFLKHVEEETRSQQRLKELLVLMCRILAIIFLVLAFAQPFIPTQQHSAGKPSRKAVSIFIDNSFSMGAEGKEGVLLEEARNKARAIVNAHGADDRFQVLTHDFDGAQQRLIGRNDAINAIDAVKMSSSSRQLKAIIARQAQALEKAPDAAHLSWIISDFQSAMLTEPLAADSALRPTLIPVQAGALHNLYIDSAWLMSPVVRVREPARIGVRIRNSGTETAEHVAIALKINGVQKALQNADCAPGSFTDVEMTFTPADNSWQNGEISLLDHPIVFDDRLFFSMRPEGVTNVLCIDGGTPAAYADAIFAGDPAFRLTHADASRLDYSSLRQQHCIIVNAVRTVSSGMAGELVKYVNEGGLLIIFPSTEPAEALSLNALLGPLRMPSISPPSAQALRVSSLNLRDDMLKDVFIRAPRNMDLPSVSRYYPLTKSAASAGTSLMTMNNGAPLLHSSRIGKGRVIVSACPPDPAWTNLQRHALFVPLMVKSAFGNAKSYRIYFVPGPDKWAELSAAPAGPEKIVRIRGQATDLVTDLKQRNGSAGVYIADQITEAGLYTVSDRSNADAPIATLAINYPRAESDVRVTGGDELSKLTGGYEVAFANVESGVISQLIAEDMSGIRLWRISLLLALLFIAIEILLLRLLR